MNDSNIEDIKREIAEAQASLERANKKLEKASRTRLPLTAAQINDMMRQRSLVRVFADGSATPDKLDEAQTPELELSESGCFVLPDGRGCWLGQMPGTLRQSEVRALLDDGRPTRKYSTKALNEKLFRTGRFASIWLGSGKDGAGGLYDCDIVEEGYAMKLRPDATFVASDDAGDRKWVGSVCAFTVYRKCRDTGDKPRLVEMQYHELVDILEG